MMTFDDQLPPDDQPDRLQSLAIQAQNQPVDSLQRHRALTLFAQEFWKNPTFANLRNHLKKKYWSLSNGLFEDLFNDALQETVIAFCRSIDKYDSGRPLLPLICTIISNKFSNLYKKHCRYGVTRVPKPNGDNQNFKQGQVISLDGLDEFVRDSMMGEYLLDAGAKSDTDCDLLRELLIDDPDNIFKSFHVRNQPHITFQYIAIYLYVKGYNMQQLTDELAIPYQTLNAFFKRKLEKLEPYFREKLQH